MVNRKCITILCWTFKIANEAAKALLVLLFINRDVYYMMFSAVSA
ncbi:Uncharacterized protein BM_BM17968 [Brugia malayi]|uniref:Uncharacterized protein n=1 Tax=Brugia malayi TaxID=6279 RepID=A0A4E9EU93_BRUMA|nr:Uncharacterized protein BM_BM17968 [Brugia malayi]VIO87767.1 Uncharacterized protein BM_BM17968 [Brugia malayi]